MMLGRVDARADGRTGAEAQGPGDRSSTGSQHDDGGAAHPAPSWFDHLPPAIPVLRDYAPERRRREEYAALGFVTDTHPMHLHAGALAGFRLCRSTELHRHVGRPVLLAGMLTTAKPVHTLQDEPMEFATFDDGDGLIEVFSNPKMRLKLSSSGGEFESTVNGLK
jgi:DNA polymerase III alpha subunit